MMQVAATLMCLACFGAVQAFTFQGNVAGPCTLSAVYPTGNANCAPADSQRAKCQKNFKVQPDGPHDVGNGTASDPTLVPVKLTYEDNAECNATAQHYNVSVFHEPKSGWDVASLLESTLENDRVILDAVQGTSASPVVFGTYSVTSSPTCRFQYKVTSGNCFLSDVPSSSGGSWPAASAACLVLSLVAAVGGLL